MDIKNIESYKKLKWINNLIGISINKNSKTNIEVSIDKNNKIDINKHFPIIRCAFSSFTTPKLDKNTLYLIVDNSFTISNNVDNVVFIDHHLIDELFEVKYFSNAELMFNNYKLIYKTLSEIIKYFYFDNIVILMHHDIDGVASGIIAKKILIDISNNFEECDKEYTDKILFAKILGNFGDINPNASVDLAKLFDTQQEISIYSKKIKLFCRSFSRYMKAVRVVFNTLDTDNSKNKFINCVKGTGVSIDDVHDIVNIIYDFISNSIEIDTKNTIMFCNELAINKKFNMIVNMYNEEMNRISNAYINPEKSDSTVFEMTVVFKNDSTNTPFKLLMIDTPFDCGRSIIYKYRVSAKYNINNKMVSNEWSYKLSDWLSSKKSKSIVSSLNNIACYNKCIGKLSLDGNNNAAFDIAVKFGGGGHANIDNGTRSLGSVTIENVNTLLDDCVILDVF
jgi:hypothetical protein